MLSWNTIQANAIAFSKKWQKAKNEEAEAQGFQLDFLRVFGVNEPMEVGKFEYKVPLLGGRTGYIDYVWKSKIAIEMKSRGKSLDEAFAQLKNYMQNLPIEEIPDLWLVCDFENIRLCRRSTNEVWNFKTKDLRKHIKRFADIAGYETERDTGKQIEVNVKAAEKMAKLYDALKDHGYDGHDLEVYLVRLLFCLFAGDTGIFPKGNFYNYIVNSKEDGSDLSHRLSDLFEVLNMRDEIRTKKRLLSEELKKFRYVNGKLFEQHLPRADFDAKTRKLLLECRENFDWSTISPAIFGAMFQGVMDKTKRREMGAHYTSEENIEKLINPLFMDGLYREFEKVKTDPTALDHFHDKISRLKFLDPACGCGNFLIVTYGKLRELELEVLKMKVGTSQLMIDIAPLLKVSVEQFYGIEYEEFPCQIAQVGMWLIDHQMNLRVSEQFGMYYARLPLTQGATIINGNALRLDWEDVVPKYELSYILGNPPFVGFTYMSAEQKADMEIIFPKTKNLDFVSAWFMKSAQYIKGTRIEVALVSTNSICQGETLPVLWKKMLNLGIVINFTRRTFVWSNEAKGKAAVHCIIVGFANFDRAEKWIFADDDLIQATNISPYLVDSGNTIVESRSNAICDVPAMVYGNKPADGGNLIIEEADYEEFIAKEPMARKFIRSLIGATEYINNKKRYCLWLVGANPAELRKLPLVAERVEKCRQMRQNSVAAGIRKFADTPTLFAQITQPEGVDFIVVPKTSSERRRYIPIGFMPSEVKVTDLVFVIPNATVYHFGILTSNVHMAWIRTVCGRLKSDYRYSRDIGYNTFPWAQANEKQQAEIEKLAQAVLDARANYPDSNLADLYDPSFMPPDLLKAHQNLDRAVMKLYGFPVKDFTEADCIAALMQRYQRLA
jgi:hypothetical protein